MAEVQQPRLPPPQTYRPPRVTGYNDDESGEQDQDEEVWSDSPSESDGDQKEPTVEIPANATIPVNQTQLRGGSRYRRRAHHQDAVADKITTTTRFSGPQRGPNHQPTSFVQPPLGISSGIKIKPGGQAIRYSEGTGGYPFPPNSQRPFTAPCPEPSTQYPPNHYPRTSYPPSPFPTDPYSSPSYHPPYPPSQYPVNQYPPPYPPVNGYPMNHYPPDRYVARTSMPPLYPQQPPIIIKDTLADKLEKVEMELSQMKLNDRVRRQKEKQRQLNEEYEKQQAEKAAKRKERKQRKETELRLQAEIQANDEKKAARRANRRLRVQEIRSEVGTTKVDEVERKATEYIFQRGQQGLNNIRIEEDKEVNGKENVLLELFQFLEARLNRQEKRSLEERSMGSNQSRRLQVVPRESDSHQSRMDPLTRNQIEDIVYDLLYRMRVAGHIQEAAYNSQKSSTVSTRPGNDDRSLVPAKNERPSFGEFYGEEHEPRFDAWRYDSREGRGAQDLAQSLNPTAIDNSDQFSNGSASKEPQLRSIRVSERDIGSARNQDSHRPLPHAVNQVPLDNKRDRRTGVVHGGNTGEHRVATEPHIGELRSKPNTTTPSNEARGPVVTQERLESRRTRGRTNPEQSHPGNYWDATIADPTDRYCSSSDESEVKNLFPNNRSSRYAIAPSHRSRRDRRSEPPPRPPVAPDPPSTEIKFNRPSRRAHVTTDVEDDEM